MSDLTDVSLQSEQYRRSDNLSARIRLHQRFSSNPYSWYRWVFDRLLEEPHSRIFEVGTGSAQLWIENVERIPAGWEIVLSDASPGMLQDAQNTLASVAHRFTFNQADVKTLPYDERFDAVLANHMLYHVSDRPRAFSEIRRVLKPGGYLYAATNGRDHMRELSGLVSEYATGVDFNDLGFTLENGAMQLAPWFSTIGLHIFESNLIVTEVEPLLDYVRSTQALRLEDPALENLAVKFRRLINAEGAVRISKSTGLFIATR